MRVRKYFFRKNDTLINLLPKKGRDLLETKSTFKSLSKRWAERSEELAKELEDKHQETLKWLEKKGIDPQKTFQKSKRGALATMAAAMVMLSSGVVPHSQPSKSSSSNDLEIEKIVGDIQSRRVSDKALLEIFQKELPRGAKHINQEQETKIANEISKTLEVSVTPELDGNRLNTSYGKIGLEQHLPRYPGETIHQHFVGGQSVYAKSGMTRNKGAFGYFAPNKASLTDEAIEKEKYYVVVQTFASPGWGKKKGIVDWYKHRKVLVVNTENGKAVVGDIADSGPAFWTGKSFGGSPELMDQLGMYSGRRDSKVLIFFIDTSKKDPKLGPI